jgi:hypothetical protein
MTIEALIAEWKAWHAKPEQVLHAADDRRLAMDAAIVDGLGWQENEANLVSLLSFIAGHRAAEKAKVPQ